MSGRWNDLGGGDSSQDFTQATQEECALEPEEYTQVEPVADGFREENEKPAQPSPWGRLMRLAGGGAIPLMPRPEQNQGRALNEVTLGRSKVCEVQVNDRRISSKHCRIYCEAVSGLLGGFEVYVEDMSANGTWVNQTTKLVRGARRLLNSGDEIALLNPHKYHKKGGGTGTGTDKEISSGEGGESGKDGDDSDHLMEAEDATYTFINLDRNRAPSHNRASSMNVAETLATGTLPGTSAPTLRSSVSGITRAHGGARKVEDLYDVREMIGHGTSGEVRRAINRATGKQVAVKVIETRKFALTPGLTPRELVQEAEMLRRVDHKYIIKLEDIFQTEGAVYLVMDLISGGDLFDRIVEKGVYAEDLAQELLFRVLTAVEYLHSKDIVHRDLKPENILLVGRDNDVDVKITDFGLAKRANKEGLKTFCGTPQYFAPEVLKRRNTVLGVGRYGKEADMWSVGVILYILLSGTHPFHSTTLFDQITHASYSMDGPEWTRITNTAKDLVSKLLTQNPKSRLTAAQALRHPFITERAAARKSMNAAQKVVEPIPPRTSNGEVEERRSQRNGNTPSVTSRRSKTGRTPSLETDASSTSHEDLSPALKSLSPAEGGGGSATGVPRMPGSPDEAATSLARFAQHSGPQANVDTSSGNKGKRQATRDSSARKSAKKDGTTDKGSMPYSQLQMHVVGVAAEDEMPALRQQGSSDTTGGKRARAANGSNSMCAPAPAGTPSRKGRSHTSKWLKNEMSPPGSVDRCSQQSKAPARGGRSDASVLHSPDCVASNLPSSSAHSPFRPSTRQAVAAELATDDICEYSSDDSPAKRTRARIAPKAPKQGARPAARLRASMNENHSNGSSMTGSGRRANGRNQQTRLDVGDKGRLDLLNLGTHAENESAVVVNGDGARAAEAVAGGAAAARKDDVGGGRPAGGIAEDTAVSAKGAERKKGNSKPQRTMTSFLKRAAVGHDPE